MVFAVDMAVAVVVVVVVECFKVAMGASDVDALRCQRLKRRRRRRRRHPRSK
jgi:hypothetical protein